MDKMIEKTYTIAEHGIGEWFCDRLVKKGYTILLHKTKQFFSMSSVLDM
jgi:hypothetical protein